MPATGDSAKLAQLEDLYRTLGPKVAHWVMRLAGPSADVDDLIQEVFLVIAERYQEFRGDSKVTTWLYGITENVVRNRRRRDRMRRWLLGSSSEAFEEIAASGGPGEALERDEMRIRIYRAMDGLSEDHRAVLILYEIEGMSGEEIAHLKGLRPEAVFMRLSRARRQFMRRFAELEELT